jgi:hypothetical protein
MLLTMESLALMLASLLCSISFISTTTSADLPSANGTVIDYAPLSNEQLTNMVNSLPSASKGEKEHLTEIFATVNSFAVKDLHQIFHPSTQLRPALDPAHTHWQENTNIEDANDSEADLEERYL